MRVRLVAVLWKSNTRRSIKLRRRGAYNTFLIHHGEDYSELLSTFYYLMMVLLYVRYFNMIEINSEMDKMEAAETRGRNNTE